MSPMSANGSSEAGCRSDVRLNNNTCSSQKELSVTASVISMTMGSLSNSLALFILVKSYGRVRIKSKAFFLLFASSLVVTDLLGHLINGSLVLLVYSSQKKWETFDPHHIVCNVFGASLVFFGLSPLFLGSAMAVERCIGVTRPIFHSTVLASHHMKRLLGLTWLLAFLVAVLPVLLWKPYKVQSSRSWCFFHMEEPRDWLDVLLSLLFSLLGLLALLLSIVCNTITSCALLLARLRRKHHCRNTSYHIEMICQLLAIMLVACVCWGPLLIHVILLSTLAKEEPASYSLLIVIRLATWNQILDPWVYILLRKAVLKKLFMLLHSCWGTNSHAMHRWHQSVHETRNIGSRSSVCRSSVCRSLRGAPLPDAAIKTIT